MATTLETTLEEKVDELETKAERIRSAKNAKSKLRSVKSQIEQLNRELASLDETADELAFYVGVLETVFDDDRSETVEQAIWNAREAADVDDEAVVEAAERQDFADLFDAVEDAEDELETATEHVDERLTQDHQKPWEEELSSAKELDRIIGGGDDEFHDIIAAMETFLAQAIWSPDNDPQTLSARWERLEDRWEANTGKHGWDAFQQEHELSDDAIGELRQFTSKDTVRLSDLSVTTLRAVKNVDELESALEVKLKSR